MQYVANGSSHEKSMEFNYLIKAADDMFEILARRVEPTSSELNEFFAIACSTLKRLERDGGFIKAVEQAGSEWRLNPSVVAIISDVRHFTDGFLQIERKVMLAAGLDECTWSYLRQAVEAVRNYSVHMGINSRRIMDSVTYLREMACDIGTELGKSIEKSATRRRALNAATRVAFGVGGGALIGVNASSIAVTIGLSTAGAAVSTAVGVGLLTRAVEAGDKEIRKEKQ